MTKEYILNFLATHKNILEERYGVKKIGLFGSYAKDCAKKDSDIDFYVIFNKKTLDNITSLWIFLENSLKSKVDLIFKHAQLRKGLKKSIESEVLFA